MKVREIMMQPVVVASELATLEEVARTMLEHRIGCVPIVNERGGLVGIVTESDFAAKKRGIPFCVFELTELFGQWLGREGAEALYAQARAMTAKQIMSSPVITASEDDSIDMVLELMLRRRLRRIPVVRDDVPIGIVARHDLLKLMLRNGAAATWDASPGI